MAPRSRAETLRLIAEGHFPLDDLREELSAFPWDAEEPLFTLRRDHVTRILERFLGGELSAAEVEAWAETLEIRDDVGFGNDGSILKNAIFTLANPSVNGALTADTARALLGTIRSP